MSPIPGTEVRRSSVVRQVAELRTISLMVRSRSRLLVEKFQRCLETALNMLAMGLMQPVGLHTDHFHHLAATGDQFSQQLTISIGNRARFWTNAFGKQGDDLGINGIRFGEPPGGTGKITDLPRIDHGNWKVRAGQHRCDRDFIIAGGLQNGERRRKRLQPAAKLVQACCVPGDGEDLIQRPNVNIKAILRDINADKARHLE